MCNDRRALSICRKDSASIAKFLSKVFTCHEIICCRNTYDAKASFHGMNIEKKWTLYDQVHTASAFY